MIIRRYTGSGLFLKWLIHTPYKGKIRHVMRDLKSFSQRHNTCIMMKITLLLITKEKKHFQILFLQRFPRSMTLTAFYLQAVSIESQILISFIIKERMDNTNV